MLLSLFLLGPDDLAHIAYRKYPSHDVKEKAVCIFEPNNQYNLLSVKI